MEHLAIDLGRRESQICVRSATGDIVEEKRLGTTALKAYLASRPPSRVVIETCAESFAVADDALAAGHEVRVVAGSLVRSLGVGSRRTKNDRKDARVLSDVSTKIDLVSVHIPSKTARERKTMCGMRDALVAARTQLVNTVRGWLRTLVTPGPRATPETFPQRMRELFGDRLPTCVARQLDAIEGLNVQIAEADAELAAEVKADPNCQRLMSVPGVGPVTALRFVATIDTVSRFKSAHQLESYLGLVPGEDSSGERVHRTHITKAGSSEMRWTLVQAAWSARRSKQPHPMVEWSLAVERRRGKRVAAMALARKIAGILFALLRDGTTYQAHRGAQPIAA